MALQTEVWVQDIIDTLERDASFTARMTNYDGYVQNNYIHVPNAGAAPVIYKNPTTFPFTPAQRVDTETLVKLDQYITQPTLVTDLESAQLSYNKREDVMGQHNRALVQNLGDNVLQALLPTTSARQVTIAQGAKLTYQDIVKVGLMLDADNVLAADRHIELPADMFADLLTDPSIFQQYVSAMQVVKDGSDAVLAINGIYLHKRPTVATFNSKSAALAYQKQCVAVAKGTVKVLVDSGDNGNGNPIYGGVLMNSILWFGQTTLRSDAKGTVGIVRA